MLQSPSFFGINVPENEKEVVQNLESCLLQLRNLVEELGHSNALFDHAELMTVTEPNPDLVMPEIAFRRMNRSRIYEPWQHIAARNGAMAIYDFYKVTQIINGMTKEASCLEHITDNAKFAESRKLFDRCFPKFAKIRTAAAHHGEHAVNPKETAKNRINFNSFPGQEDATGHLMLSGILRGREYLWTLDGEAVSYELSDITVRNLSDITELRYAGFRV